MIPDCRDSDRLGGLRRASGPVAQSCRFLSRGLNSMCPQRAAVSLFSYFEGVHIGLRVSGAMCKSDSGRHFSSGGAGCPDEGCGQCSGGYFRGSSPDHPTHCPDPIHGMREGSFSPPRDRAGGPRIQCLHVHLSTSRASRRAPAPRPRDHCGLLGAPGAGRPSWWLG